MIWTQEDMADCSGCGERWGSVASDCTQWLHNARLEVYIVGFGAANCGIFHGFPNIMGMFGGKDARRFWAQK